MKMFFVLLSLFLVSSPALAQEGESFSYAGSHDKNEQACHEYDEQESQENAERTWQNEVSNYIYNKYGSQDSPYFLNRGNINPHESDYEFGSSDGTY